MHVKEMNVPQLTRLVYASHHGGIADEALEGILQVSHANNDEDGITGLLIASDEDFVQLLEGGRTAVAKCFMRIMQDVRHQHIRVLLAGPIEQRLCEKWSLHYTDASQLDQDILSRYWINGHFEPDEMSPASLEDLFRDLSGAA